MTTLRGRTREQTKRLRAIGRFSPENVDLLAILCRRIARIRRTTGFGAYLLADGEGYVYLLRAESGVCDAMVSRLPRMLVGCYTSVTVDQLLADLLAHGP